MALAGGPGSKTPISYFPVSSAYSAYLRDELARLPISPAMESLNVSVASGICLYEAVRQRLPA